MRQDFFAAARAVAAFLAARVVVVTVGTATGSGVVSGAGSAAAFVVFYISIDRAVAALMLGV